MEKKYLLSASLVCADMLNLWDQVKKLEEAGIDYIHIDVMDWHFVPRFGLIPEIVEQVNNMTPIPMDAHFMTNNPEPYIKPFIDAWIDILAVHVEDNPNLHRTIKLIKDAWWKAWVVLNMATPLDILDYLLDDISMVMLMWINPWVVWHKIIPKIMDKIKDLKLKLKDYPDIIIEIDWWVTPETLPEMIKCWAHMFVCWTSTIFRPTQMVKEKTIELRKIVDTALNS
jgi:ribulose-phosphate 3-epimerase